MGSIIFFVVGVGYVEEGCDKQAEVYEYEQGCVYIVRSSLQPLFESYYCMVPGTIHVLSEG